MTSLIRSVVNNVKQLHDMGKHNIGKTVKMIPLLEETEGCSDMTSDFATTPRADDAPTFLLPNTPVDQPVTQLLPETPKSGTVDTPQALPLATPGASGESYFGVIRDLVKNSGIYAISSLASPLLTLLLAPFLTRMLSGTDYGALAVLTTTVLLVTGVSELGLGAAFTRMYTYDCKTQRDQLHVLSTLVLLLLLILIPITAIGVMAAPWLSTLILGNPSYSSAVQVGAVLVLSQNLTVPGLMWLRVESRAAFFSTISIGNLLITGGATFILVGTLHMGILGSLAANGLGDIIIIACTLPIIFWRAGFHLRFAMAGSMLAFGAPHVMNLVTGWVLGMSDRYLLGHFASLSQVAGYSVAYSLGGSLSSAIISPFSMAWWILMYHIAKREDAQYVFKLIFRWFSIVLLLATFGLSVFGRIVLDLVFPASYHAQSPIIPVIALSMMFNGIFVVVNLGTSLRNKTWLTALYFIFSALINVGLNIVLIPSYGPMGAALATLLAYIALALISYLFNQRIYPVPFEIGKFLVALGIGIALYFIYNGQDIVIVWIARVSTLLLYGLCLLVLECLPAIARRRHSSIEHP